MNTIGNNLERARYRIAAAARAAGRDAGSVTLTAVSKGKTKEDVLAAIGAGQKIFGENRVQEAAAKFAGLRARHPDLELHLIGPLQTNKADDAVALFDVIETLDRPKLAEALARAAKKTGRSPVCYIEVNIGGEPQKAGIAPFEIGRFLSYCREGCGLTVTGLMCIPPQQGDPAFYFVEMKKLLLQYKLPHLSMGMSADYETAIRCGATCVRVGTAIFGAR